MYVTGLAIAQLPLSVFSRGNAHENAAIGGAYLFPGETSIMQRLDRRLQQQSLLRIHGERFAIGYRKVIGIEAFDVVEITTVTLSAKLLGGAINRIGVQPRAVGCFRHGALSLPKQFPKGVDPVGLGKSQSNSDDRHAVF